MSRQSCPPASALLAFLLNYVDQAELDEIRTHVTTCPECTANLKLLQKRIPSDISFLEEVVPGVLRDIHRPRGDRRRDEAYPVSLSKGQIWVARSPDGNVRRPVLVLDLVEAAGVATVTLLSVETELASTRDLVLLSNWTLLGYPIMVEAWNQFPLLTVQFSRYLGGVDSTIVGAISRFGRTGEWRGPIGVEVGHATPEALDVRRFHLAEAEVARVLAVPALRQAASEEDKPEAYSRLQQTIAGGGKQLSLSPHIPLQRQRETVTVDVYRCSADFAQEVLVRNVQAHFYADHFVLPMSWDAPCMMVRLQGRDKKLAVRRQGDELLVRFLGPTANAWRLSPKEADAPTVFLTAGDERRVLVREALDIWLPEEVGTSA